jgi:hypothetical protein
MPIDLLGDRAREISDGLDGYTVVAHEGHEGVTRSRGVQFSPSPALLVIALKALRTWDASSGVPTWLN